MRYASIPLIECASHAFWKTLGCVCVCVRVPEGDMLTQSSLYRGNATHAFRYLVVKQAVDTKTLSKWFYNQLCRWI